MLMRYSAVQIDTTDSLELVRELTATHCNTLQHTATHCNTLEHRTTHCNRAKQAETTDYFKLVLDLINEPSDTQYFFIHFLNLILFFSEQSRQRRLTSSNSSVTSQMNPLIPNISNWLFFGFFVWIFLGQSRQKQLTTSSSFVTS